MPLPPLPRPKPWDVYGGYLQGRAMRVAFDQEQEQIKMKRDLDLARIAGWEKQNQLRDLQMKQITQEMNAPKEPKVHTLSRGAQLRDASGNLIAENQMTEPSTPQKPPSGYRWTPEGNQEFVPGGPQDPQVARTRAEQTRAPTKPAPPERNLLDMVSTLYQQDPRWEDVKFYGDDAVATEESLIQNIAIRTRQFAEAGMAWDKAYQAAAAEAAEAVKKVDYRFLSGDIPLTNKRFKGIQLPFGIGDYNIYDPYGLEVNPNNPQDPLNLFPQNK
jgi:hypothetical protein